MYKKFMINFVMLFAIPVGVYANGYCPSGWEFVDSFYGSSNSGGSAFLKIAKIKFPENFVLDTTSRQIIPADVAGGGARSTWDGIQGIPDGIYIETGGAHYWAVGVDVNGENGKPEMNFRSNGSPKNMTIGVYCGPAASGGPGCNVNVKVCGKRKMDR